MWDSRPFTTRSGESASSRRRRRRLRLALDALEPRTLLSNIAWTGAADGKTWTLAGNWSGDAVPGSKDDVTINLGGSPTIQITSGTQSVHSLMSTDPLSISGGSLSVAAGSTLSGGLSMTGGSLTSTGSRTTLTVTGATTISGASLYAQSGSTLSLPNLTSFSSDENTFQADGASSVLDVSALATLTQSGYWKIDATDGGKVNLAGLSTLTSTQGILITDTGGSSLLDPGLTTLSGVSVTLDGSDAQVANAWTTFTGGSLTVTGGSTSLSGLADALSSTIIAGGGLISLSDLTDADGSKFAVSGGGTLVVPAPTSFSAASTTLSVTGAGSSVQIGSGTLSGLPSTGTDAVIDVPQFPPGMVLNYSPGGTFTAGTTFNIGENARVNIQSGTFQGGATFNVEAGAIADIANQTVTYGGTLTGSGTGEVLMDFGTIVVPLGGLTLDFPGNLFQWAGGGMNVALGNVTNTGTINLATNSVYGAGSPHFFDDGTLFNYGTIIETGNGDFEFDEGGGFTSSVVIEPGASYLIDGDGSITCGEGTNVLDIMGILQKTAGTGVSSIAIAQPSSVINTGTVEVDSGRLFFYNASFAQFTGGTLTGGTWNALDGGELDFPSQVAITSNEANIALGGTGAKITGLSGLTSNSGAFSILNGADFATSTSFSNSGNLTIGSGSELTVNGMYTQGSSASLTIGLGGSSSGTEFGELAATGTALLGGTVIASVVAGYTPAPGDSFPIVTYANESGGGNLTFEGFTTGSLAGFQPVVGSTSITEEAAAGSANLVVQPFSVPSNATAGQNLTVNYRVDNVGSDAVTTPFTDSVYLSSQPTLTSSSVLLGRVQNTGGVAADGQYSESVTAPVPGLVAGNYYVIVLADSRGVVPQTNRAGTQLASTNPVQITVPTLTTGSSVTGTIASGQDLYYQISLAAGQDVAISADLSVLKGGELYVGYQSIPTSSASVVSSTSPAATTQQVVIPDPQAGTYYIFLTGDTGSGSGKPFSLSATLLPLQVSSIAPARSGNSGTTTLTIQGADFTAGSTVSLVPHGGGSPIAAGQVSFQSSTTLFARFNLAGAPAGAYDVVVTSGGQKSSDPLAFTVAGTAAPGNVVFNLSAPSISRPGRISYLTLTYSNNGGSDAQAPLFIASVTSGNGVIGVPGQTSLEATTVQILGIEQSGPAGTLPPGFSGTLLIPYEVTNQTPAR